jgi:hypothetical protein
VEASRIGEGRRRRLPRRAGRHGCRCDCARAWDPKPARGSASRAAHTSASAMVERLVDDVTGCTARHGGQG